MSFDPRHQLDATADAAWGRYVSTITTGGTPVQRQWAFDRWMEASDKLAAHDRHATARRKTDELPAVAKAA
jgi:hypothetical protein